MPIPRAVARFNRIVTNPVQRRWAGRLPGMAIVEHVGRRTGRTYRTPVNAFRRPGGFTLPVNYGTGSDWVRNLQAAGGGHLVYRGQRIAVSDPTLVAGPDAFADLPRPVALALRRIGASGTLRVTTG